jgi:cytochrome c1
LGAILAHGGAPAGQNAPMPPPALAARSAGSLPSCSRQRCRPWRMPTASNAAVRCSRSTSAAVATRSRASRIRTAALAQPLSAWRHRSYIAGRLPNRPDVLARWIAAPQALVPGTAMPSMGVSPEDARAMAAYLFSLR